MITITGADRTLMQGIDLGKACPRCELNVVLEAQLRAQIEMLETQIPNLKWYMANITGKLHEMLLVSESYQTKYRLVCLVFICVVVWVLRWAGAVKP